MAAAKKPKATKAKAKPKAAPKPAVFDVAKPGAPALATSSTSRPIIIKHQNVPDPMVNEKPSPEPTENERQTAPTLLSPSAKKIVIQPLHDAEEKVDVKPSEPTKPTTEPAPEIDITAALKTDKPEPKPEPAKEEPTPPKPEPKPVVVEPKVEIPKDKPVIDDEAVLAERAAQVQKLVASQEYFLPIETIEQRRTKRTAILGVLSIIVLLAAWYNVSLDAQLLPNTYNLPHTSFFGAK